MPKISQPKKDKITEQILHYLFSISPASAFTMTISKEIARDEEFTKYLLSNLKSKNLIIEVNKNSHGTPYIRRQRWRLSEEVYQIFLKKQPFPFQPIPTLPEQAKPDKHQLDNNNLYNRSYID